MKGFILLSGKGNFFEWKKTHLCRYKLFFFFFWSCGGGRGGEGGADLFCQFIFFFVDDLFFNWKKKREILTFQYVGYGLFMFVGKSNLLKGYDFAVFVNI
jgi:hypothetical protein